MTRVVCPICKAGFEARITREDYAINCVSCGVAFNAAAFLPEAEFRALAQRRPAAGSRSRYDRGTQALGGVIRPAPAKPTAYSGPAAPSTRTGGLAFMYEDPEPARPAAPAHGAQPPAAVHQRRGTAEGGCASSSPPQARPTPAGDGEAGPAAKSFFEASVTTSRFRPPAAGADAAAAPADSDSRRLPDLGAVHSPYRPMAEEARRPARTTRAAPLPPGAAANVLLRSWLAPQEQQVVASAQLPVASSQEAGDGQQETGNRKPATDGPQLPLAGGQLPDGGKQETGNGKRETAFAPRPASRPPGSGARRRPLLEGSFGPYEIEGEIARGGVGAVFRARETATGRPVALKVLLNDEDADDTDRERFRRECETAKSLALPGLVQVYSVGEVEGQPYMAMELVEGRSLDRLIAERSLSTHEALVLMQAVADTAGALHEAGYVHRDIKPANVLLDPYGTPKLADFGLVKSLDEVTRLTAAGLVCGTPAYMSPEQARGDGQTIDSRTDVWALGAVLHEVLTASPPFQADNALRLMLKITKEPPRPARQLNPKVPREVEAIILKCLHKNPDRRYPNGRTLAADLKRFLDGRPVQARSSKTVHRLLHAAQERRGVLVGVATGVLAVAAVAVALRLALAPPSATAETSRGWELLSQEQLPEAEEAFRAALRGDPRQAQARLGLGLVLGSRAVNAARRQVTDPARFREALVLTARAAEDDPQLAAQAASQAARLYMAVGLFAEEVRERERAVALRSDVPEYYQALGLAYWNLGGPIGSSGVTPGHRECYRKALMAFNSVLALDGEHPRTREYIKILQERFLAWPQQTSSVGGTQ